MLIPGGKCRHFIPGKKFQGKNVDIFSPRKENSIPRNGEIVFLEKRARHHLKVLGMCDNTFEGGSSLKKKSF